MGCRLCLPLSSAAGLPVQHRLPQRGINLRSVWPFEAQIQVEPSDGERPKLLDLCVREVFKNFREYESFDRLSSDVIQLVLNRIVKTPQRLTPEDLQIFLHCALQEFVLADCRRVNDSWMEIVGSQGGSLLNVDISNSSVTDEGLAMLATCISLQSLTIDDCYRVSNNGLSVLTGFPNLTTLSLRGSWLITPIGMQHFVHLVNLRTLDLERCPNTLGGLMYITGLTALEKLNVGWRFGVGIPSRIAFITKTGTSDITSLSGLVNLVELEISRNMVYPSCLASLAGLTKLRSLSMEGCPLAGRGVDAVAGLTELRHLNIRACVLPNSGFQKLGGLVNLRSLNIGKNYITGPYTGFLRGLTNLERLYLDFNPINDAGFEPLTGLVNLRLLDISLTSVRNDGLRLLTGLTNLESLNVADTGGEPFDGLHAIGTITSLTSLNLESKMISDAALLSLVALTGLISLDLFSAEITDTGTTYLRNFWNLQSLDLCMCRISHVGVRRIAALTSLTYLNISQNMRLTDRALVYLSGMRNLVSLNLAGTRVTTKGLCRHLRPLRQLRCLTVFGCAVSRDALFRVRNKYLPKLRVIRF